MQYDYLSLTYVGLMVWDTIDTCSFHLSLLGNLITQFAIRRKNQSDVKLLICERDRRIGVHSGVRVCGNVTNTPLVFSALRQIEDALFYLCFPASHSRPIAVFPAGKKKPTHSSWHQVSFDRNKCSSTIDQCHYIDRLLWRHVTSNL